MNDKPRTNPVRHSAFTLRRYRGANRFAAGIWRGAWTVLGLAVSAIVGNSVRADETVTGKLTVDQDNGVSALDVYGGNGGADLAVFRRDIGVNTKISFRAPGGDPQITLDDMESGGSAGLWTLGVKKTDNSFRILKSNLIQDATNEFFTIGATGNVGVGSTNPALKLEVANGGSPYNAFLSGTAPSLYFGPTSGQFPNASGNAFAGFIGLSTSSGSYGQGQGDLNIATQSRGSGNASAINFLVPSNDSGTYTLAAKITRSGNVGIGTGNPVARFHIKGIYDNANSGLMIDATDNGDPEIYNLRVFPYVVGAAMVGWKFQTKSTVGGTNVPLAFDNAGNVGIGTTNPTQKLSVNGTVRAKEVIIEASPWPDDVFAPGYALPTVEEVAAHIDANGHLPGVPSASAVAEEGVAVGEMQKTLLRKVEELTLYVIAQDKRIRELEQRLTERDTGTSPVTP